jgi:hypothetical protein
MPCLGEGVCYYEGTLEGFRVLAHKGIWKTFVHRL